MSLINNNRKIKKAVFLIAGWGTRFLPASKVLPKHILPIVDKPLIQYWVEEASNAGIEDIIFVTSKGKTAVEDHFDKSSELEDALYKKGKIDILTEIKEIHNLANFSSVRQIDFNGDGAAMQLARKLIKDDEPILFVFPDYLMPKENNTIQKLIEFYKNTGKAIIASDIVPMNKVSSYGVLDIALDDDKEVAKINGFVEKPEIKDAPSNLISMGVGVLNHEILSQLDNIQSSTKDGEIRIADAFIKHLKNDGELYVLKPVKCGYDCGSALGMLKANIHEGLRRNDLRSDLIEYMKEVLELENAKIENNVRSNSSAIK